MKTNLSSPQNAIRHGILLLVLTATVIGLPATGRAAGYDWRGGGSSNDWTNGANWQQGTPDNDGTASVRFTDSNAPFPNLNVNYSISGVRFFFNNHPTSYVIGSSNGSVLTLGSFGLQVDGPLAPQAFGCAVKLGVNQNWILNGSGGTDKRSPDTSNDLTFGAGLNLNGQTLGIYAYSNSTLHGIISGSGNLSFELGYRLTLDGASTYTGYTSIDSLLILTNNSLLSTTSELRFVSILSELNLSSSGEFGKTVYISPGSIGTLAVPSGETLTLSGLLNLGNAATFAVGSYNAGTIAANFTLQGSSQPSSFQINVDGGTLRDINGTLRLYTVLSTAGVKVSSGATYDVNGFGLKTNNLQGGGTLTSPTTATVTASAGSFSGAIGGAIALTKSDAGTLVLSGNNTYSGGTTISGGTLQIGNGGAGGSLGTGNVANNASLVFNRSDDFTLGGVISGSGSVTQSGAGATTLTATNTYSGGTTVTAGTLVASNNGKALSNGTVDIGAGGIVQLSNTNTGADVFQAANTFTGTGSLFKRGAGTVQLGGNGGNVNVSLGVGSLIEVREGTLRGSSAGQGIYTDNQSTLRISSGATFNGVEADVRVAALAGDGTLKGGYYGVGSTTVGVADGSGRFAGVIQDSGEGEPGQRAGRLTLIKVGAGTQTLSGANTYTGPTSVNGGTLLINGAHSGAGAITVQNSGSVLGGGGSVAGPITVTSGGAINPGNNQGVGGSSANVGSLSVGALTLTSGGGAIFDVNSATFYDKWLASANVNLGGASLTLNLNPNATFNGQTLDLIHTTGTLSGTFAGISNGGVYTFGGQSFRAVYTPTDFDLVAVPEPATWVGGALLLGATGFGFYRRGRVSTSA